MKKDSDIKLIVENPPTKEHIEMKLKELSEFLSKNFLRITEKLHN
jgi:hypothetical protein